MPETLLFKPAPITFTPLQESVITTLYFAEKLANYSLEQDRTLFCSAPFFLHMLGINFESYHRQKLRDLEAWGWLRIIKRSNVLYYGLTDLAAIERKNHQNFAEQAAIHKMPEFAK